MQEYLESGCMLQACLAALDAAEQPALLQLVLQDRRLADMFQLLMESASGHVEHLAAAIQSRSSILTAVWPRPLCMCGCIIVLSCLLAFYLACWCLPAHVCRHCVPFMRIGIRASIRRRCSLRSLAPHMLEWSRPAPYSSLSCWVAWSRVSCPAPSVTQSSLPISGTAAVIWRLSHWYILNLRYGCICDRINTFSSFVELVIRMSHL